ncbi:MAG: DUF4105 domain-containing protein [Tannerellaceae bacterium]|nr:DUF4105 domain-containing protein [Tannerellaceae bacterium]
MKKLLVLCFLLLLFPTIQAQTGLSKEAEISILTSTPSDEAVFTVYGHTAIRINDPVAGFDWVYNYGIFDFSAPNFIYRFTKGETDYILGVYLFKGYTAEYELRGSSVIEQVLNLTQEEKQRIWEALTENARPENRVYRYNFFFDNCSTRPVAIVEAYIDGEVEYTHSTTPKTFREMINYCTRNQPWQTFGCDLVLGSPTDRIATPHEEMFLPEYLMEAFEHAEIVSPDGSKRPLVSRTTVLTGDIPEEEVERIFFTPLLCGWILFLLILGVTGIEWKKKRYFRWLDFVIFMIAGLAGSILFFLAFVSVHPCTWPNWSLIWLHPLQLLGGMLFVVKKWRKAAYYYHFINFAALSLMLLGWYFIPQHMNAAFIPLVGILWLRSGAGVCRYKLRAE